MKSSCSITYKHIYISSFSCRYCIKNYSSRIWTFFLFYNIYTSSLTPYFKLIYSSCSKGICCCKQNFFTIIFILSCHFSNRCSFSSSIYANYQYNFFSICVLIFIITFKHHFFYYFFKSWNYFFCIIYFFFSNFFF